MLTGVTCARQCLPPRPASTSALGLQTLEPYIMCIGVLPRADGRHMRAACLPQAPNSTAALGGCALLCIARQCTACDITPRGCSALLQATSHSRS